MTRKGMWDGECFTPGCVANGAQGMSLWGPPGNDDTHRCGDCNNTIALLIPVIPERVSRHGLVDRAAYDAWTHRVATMTRAELDKSAALLRKRRDAAYRAFTTLLDAADPSLVHEQVVMLAASADLFSEHTITNWWAAHCHGSADPARRDGRGAARPMWRALAEGAGRCLRRLRRLWGDRHRLD